MRVRTLALGAAALVAAALIYDPRLRDPKLLTDPKALLALATGHQSTPATAPAQAAAPPMQAMPVPVSNVVKRTIPITLEYPGRTEAIRHVQLQAKASGYLIEQKVPDGADVAEGDLLYRIDARDYEAAMEQAKAQLERNTAALDYLRNNLDRGVDLARSGILSKDTFDQRTSAVRQAQSALAIDRAAIRSAELNLAYTEIRAPFAGRLGRNQASVGTLVSSGSTVLNSLVQIDPIYITFNPSETDLARIRKAREAGPVTAEVFPPGASGSRKGTLTFLDNSVDRTTGTIAARATIANADSALLPGQYVRIRLLLGEEADTLMIPQVALGSSQLGKFVYVIGEGGRVALRPVTVGRTQGDLVAVLSGLSEADQVISGNLQKIGPGLPVQGIPQKVAATP